jgi:cytidine deaminase
MLKEPDTQASAALCEAARTASEYAYAPYSLFRVGAAVQLSDGEITVGANVENVSFPAGVCAERIAIGAALATGAIHGGASITALAIYAESNGSIKSEPTPCGICRQWLTELAPEAVVIVCSGEDLQSYTVAELLPHPF